MLVPPLLFFLVLFHPLFPFIQSPFFISSTSLLFTGLFSPLLSVLQFFLPLSFSLVCSSSVLFTVFLALLSFLLFCLLLFSSFLTVLFPPILSFLHFFWLSLLYSSVFSSFLLFNSLVFSFSILFSFFLSSLLYSFVSYTSLLFTDCSSSFVVLFPPLLCTSCFLHNCALQLLNHFNCLLLNFLFFLLYFTVLSFTHLILLFIPLIPSFLLFFPILPFQIWLHLLHCHYFSSPFIVSSSLFSTVLFPPLFHYLVCRSKGECDRELRRGTKM